MFVVSDKSSSARKYLFGNIGTARLADGYSAGPDRFRQLGPSIDNGRQIGGNWRCFWMDGAVFGAPAA